MPSHHAKYSPSSAHRWLKCPGSIVYSALAPDTLPSTYAEDGTFVHAIGEYALEKRKHPSMLVGKRIKYDLVVNGIVQKKARKVTKEDALALTPYYMYIMGKARGGKVYIEQKVKLNEECWGTVDCFFAPKKILYVVDYKNGRLYVDPTENEQLIIYGIGALSKLGKQAKKIKKVKLVIVQPNAEGDTVKEWVISKTELLSYRARFEDIEGESLRIGSWCKWCHGSAICPERARFALSILDGEIDKETSSLEDLLRLFENKEQLRSYLDDIESHLTTLIHRGATVRGVKLVNKRSYQRWIHDDEGLLGRLRKMGYEKSFIDSFMTVRKVKPIGQMREFLVAKDLEALTERRSSGTKLVLDSAPGESVNSLLEDFDD